VKLFRIVTLMGIIAFGPMFSLAWTKGKQPGSGYGGDSFAENSQSGN
jgi:hypothetical protein